MTWQPSPTGRTEVTWTLHYRRTFDPGWYFGPIQTYGMEQAAAYLSDTFSHPTAPATAPSAAPAGTSTR
ncbi:hypothetical protein ACWEQ8_13365 [Streptomyces noursei]